ncbi:carbohydrate ABC transporter permease [Neoroseomonas lacus]|uniref:ABC transporter permease n=1 Tax=Neoroseomonas lacus TaxID=287609 RepID=A0A917KA18_9PROT|nr:sugar ABC transporter permease [Neoroseomonas lacus]GGJ02860.1 ABC transporter permease [Neoroseomonas lacus]
MVAPAARGLSALALERRRAAWLFLVPMVVTVLLVAGWPLARTIWFSLTDARLDDTAAPAFIGLENYAWLIQDPDWWNAVRNTVSFAIVSVSLETLLGLVIALALNERMRGRGLLRAAMLIPWAIPTVVSAQMWGWMLHDQVGVVNEALLALGVIARPLAFTADPDLALWAVVAVDVWKTTPFMALLILAALQLLPGEIYEAAEIDGLGPVGRFFRLTLPLIRPALMVAVIFRALDALRVFDLMYVLTGNSAATASMSVYARQHLVDFQDVGFGSAAATGLFLVIAAATVLLVTLGRVRLGAAEDGR